MSTANRRVQARFLRFLADQVESGGAVGDLDVMFDRDIVDEPCEPGHVPKKRLVTTGAKWTLRMHTIAVPKLEP